MPPKNIATNLFNGRGDKNPFTILYVCNNTKTSRPKAKIKIVNKYAIHKMECKLIRLFDLIRFKSH